MGNCCSTDQLERIGQHQKGFSHVNENEMKSIVKIQKILRGKQAKIRVNKIRELYRKNSSNELETVKVNFCPYENLSIQVQDHLYKLKDLDYNKLVQKKDDKEFADCSRLQPHQFEKTQSVYWGEWRNAQRHVIGKQIWVSGSYYNGFWKNDKAQGFGRLILADGDYYQGYWVENMAHGEGTYYKNSDKSYYIGQWENDKPNGFGEENHQGDQLNYKGYFQIGKRCEKGEFIWKNKYFQRRFCQQFKRRLRNSRMDKLGKVTRRMIK